MKANRLMLALGVCLILGAILALPTLWAEASDPAATARAAVMPSAASGSADTPGQTLSDSAVLARVDDRKVRVWDFREGFFTSDPMSRPATDSLGRVEFLNTMVSKDVLGLTALALNQPLSFEDRLSLREFESSALAKLLFARHVTDSVVVTEKDLKAAYPQFSRELSLRYVMFLDRATAQRVRSDLVRKRMTWAQALKQSQGSDSLGWVHRADMTGLLALTVFELQPGAYADVLTGDRGHVIWQCVDRRSATAPVYSAVRRTLLFDVRSARTLPRRQAFFARMRGRAEARYDSTNVVWLAGQFEKVNTPAGRTNDAPMVVDLRNRAPLAAPSDTGRVLVTTKRGTFTVHGFLQLYKSVPPMMRPKVWSYATLVDVIDRMVLEPDMASAAREEGLDKDPVLTGQIVARREALLVDRMYEDSVSTRVNVTDAERRKYYKDHINEFVTNERVRYAVIPRESEAGADSVIARLKAGESAEAIVRADSMAGRTNTSIQELVRGTPHNYTTVLFEDLREGQSAKVGPGNAIVLNVIKYMPSRSMSYEESRNLIDEWVQNGESERQLHALVERLKKRYRVESHPELVMRISLRDPAGDMTLQPGE